VIIHRGIICPDVSLFSSAVSVQTFAWFQQIFVLDFSPCVPVCAVPVAILKPVVTLCQSQCPVIAFWHHAVFS